MDEEGFFDALYEGVLTPAAWSGTIERFADLVGGGPANLTRLDVVTGAGPMITARSDPAFGPIYLERYAHQNPLNNVRDPAAYARDWRPQVLTDEDWIARDELVRTEYFNDFLRQIDRAHALFVRLALRGREVCVLNIYRTEKAGPFDRAAIERASRLQPHLIRAFSLACRLGTERAEAAGAEAVFERSPHPLILLDRRCRIVRLNPAGEALLASGCGLSVRGGRLVAHAPNNARRLEALVARAADADPQVRIGGSMTFETPTRATPLALSVSPTAGTDTSVFAGQRTALACITDMHAAPALGAGRLRELFGLTPAESRLAIALVGGDSLREAACRLGISPNTAGVHLARVFDKTGVNRQGALVGLLIRAAGPSLVEDLVNIM